MSHLVLCTLSVLVECYSSLPPCVWHCEMCKGPGQCVILCIIVNFTVIVKLSDLNLALGLLMCFLKKTTMLL